MKTVLQAIVDLTIALHAARDSRLATRADKLEAQLKEVTDLLPSGSGFDSGTSVESVSEKKVVFSTAFHHMNEHGGYCGWSDHKVTATAIFGGFDLTVYGPNKRGIKEYIGDVFHTALSAEAPERVW